MTIGELVEHMRRDVALWDKMQDDFLRYQALLLQGKAKEAEDLNWKQQAEMLVKMERLAGRMLTGSEIDQIDAALEPTVEAILGPKKSA